MKKGIYLILCCVCLLMNIRVAYGEVVKRDTLVEDFSAADIAKYKDYTTRAIDHEKEFCGVLSAYDENTVTIEDESYGQKVFDKKDIALIRLAIDF